MHMSLSGNSYYPFKFLGRIIHRLQYKLTSHMVAHTQCSVHKKSPHNKLKLSMKVTLCISATEEVWAFYKSFFMSELAIIGYAKPRIQCD